MNRALVLIAGWVGQGVALALSSLRRLPAAEIIALRERVEKLCAENELLRSRLRHLDSRARPHYRPWERLSVLMHRARYGMSLEATARAFVVTVQTLVNWTRDVEAGVTRVVRARRPLNALPDLVGELSAFLRREWPGWGTRRIAGVLAALGIKASRASVQRLLRRPLPRPAARGRRAPPAVRARHAGHVWVVDFTVVRQCFRSVGVGAVVDAWSRKVLSLGVWRPEPDVRAACLLLRRALRTNRRPTWVVSDRGTQFASARFRSFLFRRGIRRRFVALGDPNLARIDRFWRSVKGEFAQGLFLFKALAAIERDLRSYARWHAVARPRQGLALRLPERVHRGLPRPRLRAVQGGILEVRFLDGHRGLPLIRFRAAA